jgi:hypothetical protein
MMQLLAIPKSQFQKFFGQLKEYCTSEWCLNGTALKGLETATPQVSLFVFPSLWLGTF